MEPAKERRPSNWTWIVLGSFIALAVVVGGVAISALFGKQIEHYNVAFDVDPKGGRIVFSSAKGELYLLDLRKKKLTTLSNSPGIKSTPKFSPDGSEIAFAMINGAGPDASLYEISAKGGKVKRLTNAPSVEDAQPCFSPDGQYLAFVRASRRRPYSMGGIVWTDFDLFALELKSGKILRLTNQRYYSLGGLAFKNGVIIFRATTLDGPVEGSMFQIRMGEGEHPTGFGPNPDATFHGASWMSEQAFSQDLKKMAFISDRVEPYAYDAYVADANASNARSLDVTRLSRYNSSPEFSADGKEILFLAGTESNSGGRPIYSLYQADLSGKLTKIADSGLFTNPETWRPK